MNKFEFEEYMDNHPNIVLVSMHSKNLTAMLQESWLLPLNEKITREDDLKWIYKGMRITIDDSLKNEIVIQNNQGEEVRFDFDERRI